MVIKSFDDAHDFWPTVRPRTVSVFTTLRLIFEACREGLAASRKYEELRARGVPHRIAAERAVALTESAA
jgi:hypothetical protein